MNYLKKYKSSIALGISMPIIIFIVAMICAIVFDAIQLPQGAIDLICYLAEITSASIFIHKFHTYYPQKKYTKGICIYSSFIIFLSIICIVCEYL